MHRFVRPLVVVVMVLLVPIVPFLGFGKQLEERVAGWLDPPPPPWTLAAGTAGLLACDIFLPIPSSLVSTLAGAELGVLPGMTASWIGMTIGSVLGFAVARRWGRPIALKFSSAEDLDRMHELSARLGPLLVVLTRALPVLAEAAVLLLGTARLSWRAFLPALALSNLGLALAYAVLGRVSQSAGQLPLALAASIALPLVAATIARKLLPRTAPQLAASHVETHAGPTDRNS